MSRKERRAWHRANTMWILSARSTIAELHIALSCLKGGRYDAGLEMARYARQSARYARHRLTEASSSKGVS